MATKFSIKKLRVKHSGASDADLSKIALKEYGAKFAKQELPNADELRNILDAFPLTYLDLKDRALQEMILFSSEAIRQKELELAALDSPSAPKSGGVKGGLTSSLRQSKDRQDKFLKQEAMSWKGLRALRDDVGLDPKDHHLGHKDLSVSLLRLKFIEDNWPKDKLTSLQMKQLKNAQVLLTKIDKLSYSDAVKLGFGKASATGTKINPKLSDIPALIAMAEEDHKISLKLVRETYIDLIKGESKIAVEWEDATLNKYKGKLSALVTKQLKAVYDTNSKATKTVFDNLDIMNVEASPTFLQDMEAMLTTAILGKKLPKRKRKSVSKTEYKLLSPKKVRAARRKLEGKKLPKLPTFKQINAGADLPLYSIMALINESLAEQIKGNMGDSNAPPVLLRNQTGRFAESARMLTLTRTQAKTLVGTYTYQKNPYEVFAPGHRLGTPKRNPKVYIEGSIRELAMAIMKLKFPGLTLEVV